MEHTCCGCFNGTLNEQGICTACGYSSAKDHENYPLALPAGSILYGRYIIGKVLGQGGFGITYLAQDYQTKTLVAIKEFFPDTMVTRTQTITVTPFTGERGENFAYGKTSFLDEAQTMAEFNGNPNIAGVQMYFEENGTGYYVMEYIDGTSFESYIKSHGGRLSWDETLKIMLPVLKALDAVHAKGIIHRDVTPDNIYITKDGTVKLLDFGAARHSLGNVSRSLDVILKHGFAPKEQYSRRGKQGPYTDVYAASATIYYAITGTKPDDAIERSTEDNMPLPSNIGAKVTPLQEDVLLRGLAINAQDRYQTMGEFCAALAGTGRTEEIPTVTVTGTGTRTVTAIHTETTTRTQEEQIKDGKTGSETENYKKKVSIHTILIVAGVAVCFLIFWFAHPHNYGALEVVKAATCTEDGLKEHRCKLCGKVKDYVIPRTGHTIVRDAAVAANCTTAGKTEGSHCSVCNEVLEKQQTIAKLSHSMVTKEAVAATCTTNGMTEGIVCERCGYAEVAQTTVNAKGHNFSGNDCSRCDAKKWWVTFTTTQKTFTKGERIEVHFTIKTNDKSSNAKTKIYYKVDWKFSNGGTENGYKKPFGDDEETTAGTGWYVYWANGVSNAGTATLYVYDKDNYLLGSYTFTVK